MWTSNTGISISFRLSIYICSANRVIVFRALVTYSTNIYTFNNVNRDLLTWVKTLRFNNIISRIGSYSIFSIRLRFVIPGASIIDEVIISIKFFSLFKSKIFSFFSLAGSFFVFDIFIRSTSSTNIREGFSLSVFSIGTNRPVFQCTNFSSFLFRGTEYKFFIFLIKLFLFLFLYAFSFFYFLYLLIGTS